VILWVLIVGAAGYRLGRVVALDSIFDTPRMWVYRKAYQPDPSGLSLRKVERAEKNDGLVIGDWWWRWLYGLVSCPLCCGWWITLVLWFAWTEWTFTTRNVIAGIAAAGVQCALTLSTAK
jgi:hypothetical protein